MIRLMTAIGVALATIAGSGVAAAQTVTWGVKGGLLSAALNTSGAGAPDTDRDTGLAVGGLVSWELSPTLRFQPEWLLSVRRFSITGADVPIDVAATSLEMPLLLQVVLMQDRPRLLLFAGPQWSFIGRVRQRVGTMKSDVSGDIKNVDVGITLGGGIEFPLGRGALTLDARTNLGGRNLNEAAVPVFKSRALGVLAGYRF